MPTTNRPLADTALGPQRTGEHAEQISTAMGFAAILLWSANIGIARSLAESVGAVTSTALMFSIGGGLGMIVAVAQGRVGAIMRLPARYLVVCGGIFVGYAVCLSLAIGLSVNRQQTLEVAILNYLWPSLTLLFSIPILGKRVKPAFALGFVVALGGVVLAPLRLRVWEPETLSENLLAHPWPYALATIAAVLWGLYSNLSRRWAGLAPAGAVPLFSLASGCALLAVRPLFTEPAAWSTRAVVELLFMALFLTLIAYGMWDRAMRRGRVTLVVSASYAIPVLSTLVSAAYLQVPVAWNVWAACGLVAVGASLCHASMKDQSTTTRHDRKRAACHGLWLVLLATLIVLAPSSAFADDCEQVTQGWLDRCHQPGGPPMRVVGCPPGRVLLRVGVEPATALDIEVSQFARAPFRSVKGYGLSPVGEYVDWSREPKARQDALDRIAACLERDPTLGQDARDGSPGTAAPNDRLSMPWLLLGAMVVLLASILRRHRFNHAFALRGQSVAEWARNAWRGVGMAGLLAMLVGTTSVLVIRALAKPAFFFHQNGQGPFWIEIALRDASTSRYGPGYAELFGWVARWGNPPDAAVFASIATVSALIPWFGWLIARRAGAPVCAAWAAAGLLAVHPLVIRLAQSESYLGVQLILMFAAAAVLSGVDRRASLRSPAFLLPTAAAGLLLAQVVRIHPTAWVPAAAVPVVLLCMGGSLRTRLVQWMASGLGIGVIVLAASGSAVSHVLSGSLGQQWKPSSFLALPELSTHGWIAIVACLVMVLVSRNRLRAMVPLAVGGALVFIAAMTDLLAYNREWVADAYRIQFAPTLLASCVALLRAAAVRWPRRGAIAMSATVAVIGAILTGIRCEVHSLIPTDALEQRWAMQWRTKLPPGAKVNYLGRAGSRIVGLPLYDTSEISADGRTAQALAVLPRMAGSLVFYYRSSLCFTPEGAPACRAFEGGLELEPVDMRALPTESSLPWLPVEGPIEVGLFRVRSLR